MHYTNPHGPGCPWFDITERQGAPNIKWCEETLCQWVSEPANTWSNLGYLIVGLLITYLAFKKKQSFEIKQFGPIVFFMGACSFFYHQSNFYGSQILDFVGMFFFVGWAIGMNLIRMGKLQKKRLILFNLIFGSSLTLLMHVMYLMSIKFQAIILLAAFIIIGTEIAAGRKRPTPRNWFIGAITTLVVAFGFSIADGQRVWCIPENHGWFEQGHALWHWIVSPAMYMIYKHYSQEETGLS